MSRWPPASLWLPPGEGCKDMQSHRGATTHVLPAGIGLAPQAGGGISESVTTGGFTCQIMNLCKLVPHLPETPAPAEHCFPLPLLQKRHESPRMAYCFVSPASLSAHSHVPFCHQMAWQSSSSWSWWWPPGTWVFVCEPCAGRALGMYM